MGEVHIEIEKPLPAGMRKLVLVTHDESTNTANDGPKASWVMEGEQPILKKGAGRGSRRSDVICSMYGWMKGAGVQLEYGKNYEGYWTGEMFVAQVIAIPKLIICCVLMQIQQLRDKIIPKFERLHGPEYQALIMVDNSQGHAAYPADALLVSKMNFNPGGAQSRLRDGWFINPEGERIVQPMIFPEQHPKYPGQPKRMKQVLIEQGLFQANLKMECKKPKCDAEATNCCAT
jgi:hypothetical protein